MSKKTKKVQKKKKNKQRKPLGAGQWLILIVATLIVGFFFGKTINENTELNKLAKDLGIYELGIVGKAADVKPEDKEITVELSLESLDMVNSLLSREPVYREIIKEKNLNVSLVDIYNNTLSDNDKKVLEKEFITKYAPIQESILEKTKQVFLENNFSVTYAEFLKDKKSVSEEELLKIYNLIFGEVTLEDLSTLEGVTLSSVADAKYVPYMDSLTYLAVNDDTGVLDVSMLEQAPLEHVIVKTSGVENSATFTKMKTLTKLELITENIK